MKTRQVSVAILNALFILIVFLLTGQVTQAETIQPHPSSDNHADPSLETITPKNSSLITFTPAFTHYLPLVARNYPPLFYHWLSQQQDSTTGLLPSQQDNFASMYNNALAAMVFTLKRGDYTKAKRILDYFNSRAGEFFDDNACVDFSCSQTHLCGASAPCGFFQYRDSRTGIPFSNVNRWMGDNAWLLMAIHHYQVKTGDTSYASMAAAIVKLLKSLQQPDGYIATGWENGDSTFNSAGHAEGNLDAYKALSLSGETLAAQQVKHWLDFTNLNWEKGPLDLHSWRILSLGKEYGFSLPATERIDDSTPYKSTISHNSSVVTGFLPFSDYVSQCQMNNIWAEGTGQIAVAFYKAGYKLQGDFYVSELNKLLFKPAAFPGTQAISFLALPDSICHPWVDTSKGHVAAVTWYIFARERFDPFDGVTIDSFEIENPVAKAEAENYDNSFGEGIRLDNAGQLSEGLGIHLAGDDAASANNSGWVEYKFNVLAPVTVITISISYADDLGGDTGKIFLDGNLLTNFNTADTGTWNNYIVTNFPVSPIQLQSCLHTLRLEVADNGTYGFTVDYLQISK